MATPSPQGMSIGEWQKRLADNFSVDGCVGGSMIGIFAREDKVSSHLVATYRGHHTLVDAFSGFFVDTLTLAAHQVAKGGWPPACLNYPVALAQFSNLFRRWRACELLCFKGYPLDAYALMRDLKDRTFLLAGVARNLTTFPGVIGAPQVKPEDAKEYKKQLTRNRKDVENRITNRLMGKTSGLPIGDQENLKTWDEFFHHEVHGGGISLVQELRLIAEGKIPQIGPTDDQDAFILYFNRCAELGWLMVRLLPYLQTTIGTFGAVWHTKYEILDDSFRYMLEGFASLGKALGPSFIAMVDSAFAFGSEFCYFEADGSAS